MDDYAHLHAVITAGDTSVGVHRWARHYLAGVLDGRVAVTAVRHPLGFWCFPAWRGGDDGVCLHVWEDGLRDERTIHAHSWDLLSVVLYGTVGNEIVVLDPACPSYRVLEIDSTAAGDRVRATSRVVGYRIRSRREYRSGQIYDLPHGSFHISDVRGDAATVVLGHGRRWGSDRSLGALDTADHWVRRRRGTAPETCRLARIVLAQLDRFDQPERTENRCETST